MKSQMAFSVSRILQLGTFLLIFLVGFSYTADAQNRTKKKSDVDEYFDEDGFGPHRFWYGAGFGVPNFYSNGQQSNFQLSLAPIVGYKLTPNFSVGTRGSVGYRHYRERTSGAVAYKQNSWNLGIGGFARHKFLQQYFVHAEYQIESSIDYASDPTAPSTPTESFRSRQDNFFVGGGFSNGGGLLGYEISILYNVLDDGSVNLPLDYRVAITYNF